MILLLSQQKLEANYRTYHMYLWLTGCTAASTVYHCPSLPVFCRIKLGGRYSPIHVHYF